jgi:proteasome lid subunit RPN8/RPN11
MNLIEIPKHIYRQINAHGETSYPEEGAGFLLGADGNKRQVKAILALNNAREDGARHDRYLITPQDYLHGEQEAAKLGLEVIGVFHSHPDHPDQPSEFDRKWALPWFSYLITSIQAGKAIESRSWRLSEDRSYFEEEQLSITTTHNGIRTGEARDSS